MKSIVISANTAILLTLFTTSGMAAPHHGGGYFLNMFDTNQDKMVTRDELASAGALHFASMDADGNGVVSLDEFRQHRMGHSKEHKASYFSSIDSNNDSKISKQEFLDHKQQRAEKRFNDMDSDGDGSLSADEFASSRKGHGDGHHGMGSCDDKMGHHGMGHHDDKMGMHGDGHKGGGYFAMMDADSNGEITLDEATASWKKWFDKLDTNGDQTVSEEETQAVLMKHDWK